MGTKYPIISRGEGSVEIGNTINHSELLLSVSLTDINDGDVIPIYVLISSPVLIARTAARALFSGIAYHEDYDCSGVDGHAVWLYHDYHPEGGYFEGIQFVELDIKGQVVKHSTDEIFDLDILANDRKLSPGKPSVPTGLRVKKGK